MIYALTGRKGVGKSVAATYLKEKTGAKQINFKDAMIKEMQENFPDLLHELEEIYFDGERIKCVDDLFKVKPPAMRRLMQNYGTNVRRKQDEYYWVRHWLMATLDLGGSRAHQATLTNVVVDDVRFHNEAQAVRDQGGIIIRLERPDIQATDTHISETEMDAIAPDYTITVGKGEFEKLYTELAEIVHKHG